MWSKAQLRDLAAARKRPVAVKIGELAEATVARLLRFWSVKRDSNILADALRNRAERDMPFEQEAYLSAHYRQIELQELRPGGNINDRRHYTHPVCDHLMGEIDAVAGPSYRARISTLAVDAAIPEHIDDPQQLRVVALLSGQHEFTLKPKSGDVTVPMRSGELWFVNTAWPHTVRSIRDGERVALLLNLFDMPDVRAAVGQAEEVSV